MKKIPSIYQQRVLWNALTGLGMLTIGALVVGLVLLFAYVVGFLQPVLIPLAVAGIIAYLLEPMVVKLVRRGLSRTHAVLLVFLGFFLLIGGTMAIVVPRTIDQAHRLLGQRVQIYESVKAKVYTYLDTHKEGPMNQWITREPGPDGKLQPSKAEMWVEENAGRISGAAWTVVSRGFHGVLSFFGILVGVFLIPIYLWFFLKESTSIQNNWEKFVPLRASRFKTELVSVMGEINSYLIAFFRGQMMVSCIDGLLVGIGLTLFGLPYGLLIGIFVALLGLMPYVGSLLCWLPAALISIAHFSMPANQHAWLGSMSDNIWIYPLLVTLIFVGVQQINSFVTAPKIVGDSVGLHPMTVIFSVFFWTLLLGGALGTLLAVPMSAAVKVLFRRYVWTRPGRRMGGPDSGGAADEPQGEPAPVEEAAGTGPA